MYQIVFYLYVIARNKLRNIDTVNRFGICQNIIREWQCWAARNEAAVLSAFKIAIVPLEPLLAH